MTPGQQRQERRLAGAGTDFGLAEVCMGWAGAVTVERRAERDRAAHRLGQIEVQCWPISTLESLPTLAMALIGEIAHRPHGTSCEGGTSPRLESYWWRAKSEVAEAWAR